MPSSVLQNTTLVASLLVVSVSVLVVDLVVVSVDVVDFVAVVYFVAMSLDVALAVSSTTQTEVCATDDKAF